MYTYIYIYIYMYVCEGQGHFLVLQRLQDRGRNKMGRPWSGWMEESLVSSTCEDFVILWLLLDKEIGL